MTDRRFRFSFLEPGGGRRSAHFRKASQPLPRCTLRPYTHEDDDEREYDDEDAEKQDGDDDHGDGVTILISARKTCIQPVTQRSLLYSRL